MTTGDPGVEEFSTADAAQVEIVTPGLFEAAADRQATAEAAAAAAPAAPERPDLAMVQTLAPELRPLVQRLLSSLADNKYMLGRRYAEWCTGSPTLESAVAAAAMAQDELGHARSFYPLLRGFAGAADREVMTMEEKGWQHQPTSAIACLDLKFDSWSGFIAANLLIDGGFTVLFEAAADSPYEPLRQRARKILQEEAPHRVYAEGWSGRLAATPSFEEHLETMWPHIATWFGTPEDPVFSVLARAGLIASGPTTLRERLKDSLLPLLEPLGLGNVVRDSLPWEAWDENSRRLQQDEDL